MAGAPSRAPQAVVMDYRKSVAGRGAAFAKGIADPAGRDRHVVEEVATIVEVFGLQPVYVMPEGVSEEVLRLRTQKIAGEVLARGWNLTTRLHILLYGNRRGV
jgi:7-carboxy-7-deazaguanine synthase